MFVLEDEELVPIDRVASTGLAVSADGRRLARLHWSPDQQDEPGELLVYDHRGLVVHRRLDDLHQPHSALWDGGTLIVVSTGTNTILWVDESGGVKRKWQAPGEGDCWHLNSLAVHERRLLVSAFGRFHAHHDWVQPAVREGTGMVVDIRSGRDILTGLSAPHNPVWLDGTWLICNSGKGELLRLDARHRIVSRQQFPGWTRGLAYDERHVYLGVSAHRLRGEESCAAFVVVLTRDGLEEVARWAMPSREIYDVAIVPEDLLAGMRASLCSVVDGYPS